MRGLSARCFARRIKMRLEDIYPLLSDFVRVEVVDVDDVSLSEYDGRNSIDPRFNFWTVAALKPVSFNELIVVVKEENDGEERI